ncbi:helix-turn-helix transcriptional regulator [Paenibacillus sp. FSL K6-1217]|uniref:helix-turn-helix domain-containing protein n=1 Tax=Paenibacillus sp. FSL K6-1217 TaxID=2921466 RepID=UPI0032480C2B
MKSFGERLSYLRNKKGLSQEELSKILKIAKSTLGMYEIDKREPNHEMTAKIAEFFGVNVGWMTTGKIEKESVPDTLPEAVILNVIKEAEAKYNINLRDDPLVEGAVRDLIDNIAKIKLAENKDR